MKTRIMSVVLTVVMLLALVPMSAFAAAPDMSKNIIDVTAANAQDVLDGKYGSIDGKTINFTESISTVLELARPTKYQGSNTVYYNYVDYNLETTPTAWSDNISNVMNNNSHYYRTVKNVVFTASKDVTLAGFVASAGHNHTDGYDCVRNVATGSGVTFYDHRTIENITFKGLTITGSINMGFTGDFATVKNVYFYGCNFTGTTKVGNTPAIRMYTDKYIENTKVQYCDINNYYQGIYLHGVDGAAVTNNTVKNTTHNAIAIQSQTGNDVKGEIWINVNYMENVEDRAIRFNAISETAKIRILNNIMNNAEDEDGEAIKANNVPDDTTLIIMNNYLNGADTLSGIKDAIKGFDKAPNLINNIGVRSGVFKQDVSAFMYPGYAQNENGQVMIQRNITIENGTANVSKAIAGQTVTIDADDIIGGKQFMYWEVKTADGSPVQFIGGKASEITSFIMPNCDVTITAVYRAVLPMFMHSIIVVDSDYGTTSPTGIMLVMQGLSHKFTFTPDEGCEIVDVLINGESVGAVDSYRLTVNEFVNTVEAVYAPIVDAD